MVGVVFGVGVQIGWLVSRFRLAKVKPDESRRRRRWRTGMSEIGGTDASRVSADGARYTNQYQHDPGVWVLVMVGRGLRAGRW